MMNTSRKSMLLYAALALAAAAVLVVLASLLTARPAAPSIEFTTLDGQRLSTQALRGKVVADLTTKPSTQRHVAEITIQPPLDDQGQPITEDQVEVRHILYAPNHDASKASSVPATDPAWKAAEDLARATYEKLKKDPDPKKFAEIAKKESDDKGTGASGGEYSKTRFGSSRMDAISWRMRGCTVFGPVDHRASCKSTIFSVPRTSRVTSAWVWVGRCGSCATRVMPAPWPDR